MASNLPAHTNKFCSVFLAYLSIDISKSTLAVINILRPYLLSINFMHVLVLAVLNYVISLLNLKCLYCTVVELFDVGKSLLGNSRINGHVLYPFNWYNLIKTLLSALETMLHNASMTLYQDVDISFILL